MVIDATPMSPTANSYITRTDAASRLADNRLYDQAWIAATDADKDSALIWATTLIDQSFDFFGSIRTQEQSLRFPRYGLTDRDRRFIDTETIPTILKQATAEFALALLERNRTGDPAVIGLGFSRAKVDVLEIELDKNAAQQYPDLIPQHIISMLSVFGTPNNSLSRTDAMVKVMRA